MEDVILSDPYTVGASILVTLRLLEGPDCDDLSLLFEEMQTHYTVFCPPRETIVANLRNLPAGTEVLVATNVDRIVAFAAFSTVFPGPGLKPGFFSIRRVEVKALKTVPLCQHLTSSQARASLRDRLCGPPSMGSVE